MEHGAKQTINRNKWPKSFVLLALVLALISASFVGCSTDSKSTPENNTDELSGPVVDSASIPTEVISQETGSVAEDISGNHWEFDMSENHGMNATLLQELHGALESTQMLSFVTVRDGYIVDEYYKEGYDENSIFTYQSGSKSFTSALLGIAMDEGYIAGLDVSIAEYFPQLKDTDKEAVTIRHLLEHTSGIQWFEWGDNASSWDVWRNSENWVDYVLTQPVVTTPGSTFNYSTGGTHLLSAILEQVTGESLLEYGRRHLFEPMSMDSATWGTDPQGITDGGNGIAMTARDAAKFGQLFLDGGNWKGRQLVPAAWVEESTSRQSSGSGSAGVYGFQWWIRQFGEKEYRTYYAMGHAGQYILVVPDLKLVSVITSTLNQTTYTPWPYFSDYVVDACE